MAYPNLVPGYDVRLTVFSKCANIINSTSFGAQVMLDALLTAEWWESSDPWGKWMKNLPVYDKAIPIREWDYFLKMGFLVGMFSSIESSFRDYFKALKLPGEPSEDFRCIRDKLFDKLDIDDEYRKLLSMFGLVRNSMHNNGMHYADWTTEPIKITYRNVEHVFRNGEVVRMEWKGALTLANDCKQMLVEVVNRRSLISIPTIKDSVAPSKRHMP